MNKFHSNLLLLRNESTYSKLLLNSFLFASSKSNNTFFAHHHGMLRRASSPTNFYLNVDERGQHGKSLPHLLDADKLASRYVFHGAHVTPPFDMQANMSVPKLDEGEVLVRVRSATICLSDIHTVCGSRVEPTPSVLGHEACVEILDHRRDDSFQLQVGDRATFSIADVCGECEYCQNNLSQKCVKLFKYGHATLQNGTGFNGCYASHIVLRKGTTIIKLPDAINDRLGASINCALATMVNCVEQIPWEVKRRANKVLIQGDGMLGLYGIALLKQLGISQVYCCGHQEARREIIKSFGAIPIINGIIIKQDYLFL